MEKYEMRNLKDICISVTDCPHSTPIWTLSGRVVVRNQNIIDGRLDLTSPSFTDETNYKKRIARANPLPGDIIITREAPMGRVCRIPDGLSCCLGQRMVLLKPEKKNVDGTYLLYALRSQYVQNQISWSEGTGTTVSNLRIPVLEKIKIPFPDIYTQRFIGGTLSCLDDKIELNNRMNRTLEEMAQAIFKSWFVDFEPFQDGEFIDSELGRIPKGWEVGTLGDICSYTSERISIDSLSLSTYISTENMLPNKAGYINASGLPSVSQTTKFSAGDILISNIRPYFKKIVFCSHDGGCSADVLCLKSTRFQFASFTYFVVFSDRFFDLMMLGSKGTKMPRGDKSQIMKYKIIIPSDNAQETFCKIVDPIIQIINQNKFENNNLSSLRDTLLPKLMSGEIRVPIQEE